jgi:hypothetical protein
MVDHTHGIFGESAPEPGKGRMIGRRLIEGKTQKRLKGGPVVDLGFQLRIGVDSEPLLKQQAFHEDQRGISLVAFGAFADGIVSQEEGFDSVPIHNGIDLLMARLRSIEENSEISAKEKLVSIFLKLMGPPG